MAMGPLGALKIASPRQWEKKIRSAMNAAGGRIPIAAEALGVSARQLYKWLDDPALADVERARCNVAVQGRPLGARDKAPRKKRAAKPKVPTRAEKRRATRKGARDR